MHHTPFKLFRQVPLTLAIILQLVLLVTGVQVRAASPVQDGYNPDIDGIVHASITLPDGSLLVGGTFSHVGTEACTNLARIRVDGSMDTSFPYGLNGMVTAFAREPNGSIIIGGSFAKIYTVNRTATEVARNHLVRLLWNASTGSFTLDETFKPSVTLVGPFGDLSGMDNAESESNSNAFRVKAIAVQNDGKILVGGYFDRYTNTADTVPSVEKVKNLVRLNYDGSRDATFTVGADDIVNAILVRPNSSAGDLGNIILGGGFKNLFAAVDKTTGATTATTAVIARLASVKSDGTVNVGFHPTPNDRVNALINAADGSIMAGGAFTEVNPTMVDDAERIINCLCKVTEAGALHSTFATSANGEVMALALQPDGAVLVGGQFRELRYVNTVDSDYVTATTYYLGRLTAAGKPDTTFAVYPDNFVSNIAIQSDGSVLMGGYFSRLSVPGDAISTPRNHLARLFTDGTPDTDFNSVSTGTYSGAIKLSDGKTLVYGSFMDVGGYSRRSVAMLKADGTLDTSFSLTVDGAIYTAAYDKNNRLLIGGTFTKVGNKACPYIARITSTGALDESFVNPQPNSYVSLLAVEQNGNIVLAGGFSYIGTTSVSYLARVSDTGVLDKDYAPTPALAPAKMHARKDGKLLIAGNFSYLVPSTGTVYVNYMCRLNADGTVDTTYKSPAEVNGAVTDWILDENEDVKYLVGSMGLATASGWVDSTDADNIKVYQVGGIVRLKSDATIDKDFVVRTDNTVNSVKLFNDKLYIGGSFTKIYTGYYLSDETPTSTSLYYMARLSTTGTLDKVWNPNPDALVSRIYDFDSQNLLVLGNFVSFRPENSLSPIATPNIAVINTTTPASGNTVYVNTELKPRAPQSLAEGKRVNFVMHDTESSFIVGGSFDPIKGSVKNNLMRMTSAGRYDDSFDASTNGEVTSAVTLPVEYTEISKKIGLQWLAKDTASQFIPLDKLMTQIPLISGEVYASAMTRDGQLYIGGSFTASITSNDGQSVVVVKNLGRVIYDAAKATYRLDPTFTPYVDAAVYSLALESDNLIWAGGAFTYVNGVNIPYLARIWNNGIPDVNCLVRPDAAVSEMVFNADRTKLYIAGSFTYLYGTSETTTSRYYLARLSMSTDADTKRYGILDSAWYPTPSGEIYSMAMQSDDKLVLGGAFNTFLPNGASTYTTLPYLARLNTDGTVDGDFKPVPNGAVRKVIVESTGSILAAGYFDAFSPGDTDREELTKRTYLARITSAGLLDDSISLSINGAITGLGKQSDGSLIVTGSFTSIGDKACPQVARLVYADSKYTVDTYADLRVATTPQTVMVINQSGAAAHDSIVLGGSFYLTHLAPAFVVGGDFTELGHSNVTRLAAVYADGSANPKFNPAPNAKVYAIVRQADGKYIIGGDFTSIAGVTRNYLARLNTDGSIESTFNAANVVSASVRSICELDTGSLLVGLSNGTIVLVNATGTSATVANSSLGGDVKAITTTTAGVVLAGSSAAPYFTSFVRPDLAFTTAPSLPTIAGFNGEVSSIIESADGTLNIAGKFTSLTGASSAPYFIRVAADGTLVKPLATVDGPISTMTLTEEGKLILGGSFSEIDGQNRFMLARLAAPASAEQRLVYSNTNNAVTWIRNGSLPMPSRAVLEVSTDFGTTWIEKGAMTRSANTFVLSNIDPESDSYYYRARAYMQTTPYGSGGIVSRKASGLKTTLNEETSISGVVFDITTKRINLVSVIGLIPQSVTNADGGALPAGVTFDPKTGILTYENLGSYSLLISWFDGVNQHTITYSFAVSDTRIINSSCLYQLPAGSDKKITMGFVVNPSEALTKRVLVRIAGPALAQFGFAESALVSSPSATLHQISTGTVVGAAQRTGWVNDADMVSAMTNAHPGFSFAEGSKDVAFVADLLPGSYTVEVADTTAIGGKVLVEIYDASADFATEKAQVFNTSVNARTVSAPSSPLTIGFTVINSTGAKHRVLIRALGPTLKTVSGLADACMNPVINVFRITENATESTRVATNDSYLSQVHIQGSPVTVYPVSAVKSAMATHTGYQLHSTDSDSAALLLDLPEGAYTVEVVAAEGVANGTVVLEVYKIQ